MISIQDKVDLVNKLFSDYDPVYSDPLEVFQEMVDWLQIHVKPEDVFPDCRLHKKESNVS